MLHLILKLVPSPLHRLGLRLAHTLRLAWWRARKPVVVGCQVLAINPAGEVLLVRHSYGSPLWMLPGGGVARGEAPIATATRELAEETACTLTGAVEVAVMRDNQHGAQGVRYIVAGTTSDTPRPDGREILAARWFAPDALPADASPKLVANLAAWLRSFKASEQG